MKEIDALVKQKKLNIRELHKIIEKELNNIIEGVINEG